MAGILIVTRVTPPDIIHKNRSLFTDDSFRLNDIPRHCRSGNFEIIGNLTEEAVVKRAMRGLTTVCLSLAMIMMGIVPASGATSFTEDASYCRHVRGLSGLEYRSRGTRYEKVPITEVHTAGNVFAEYKYGQTVSVKLNGGLNATGGGWSVSATSGQTKSVTLTRSLPVFAGNTHKKIYANWRYQKRQIICTAKDPRSGQVIRRDYTPRHRYVPMNWTGELSTGAASKSVPKCNSDRKVLGKNKVRVFRGPGNRVNINLSRTYSSGMTLSGIGLSATASTTSGASSDFGFYTSSGTSYVCGNASRIEDSSKLYANAL